MKTLPESPYSTNFYSNYVGDSGGSAKEIVPYLIELFNPSSVIDVGCGIGTWLNAFSNEGVAELYGLDGAYVAAEQFIAKSAKFTAVDLEHPEKISHKPCDLAISLEVAEHLNEKTSDAFVNLLTSLSDRIAFSAAIPYQGGTFHINEQWQSYWAKKFLGRGFQCSDIIRERFWNNSKCAYYYPQNMLLFVKESAANPFSHLRFYKSEEELAHLDTVHPRKWIESQDLNRLGMRKIISALPAALRMATSNIFRAKNR